MKNNIILDKEELNNLVIKEMCEKSHLAFTRYFFKKRHGIKFLINWHHKIIADAIDKIITGEYCNLVINVPPGSSKTEMAVINFIARGLAINPNSRFLHISSGDDLALLNSQTARDLVLSDEYQALWKLKIASDSKSKKRWNILVERENQYNNQTKLIKAGGVYAVAMGGQITGFRAGHMAEGFQGAIIIDDPLKAEDAYSKTAKQTANRTLINTIESRKANPKVPMILIMQRLAIDDCTGFIKGGNLGEDWTFINIPALINQEYYNNLPHQIQKQMVTSPKDKDNRFSYWEYKEPLAKMLARENGTGEDAEGNKINRFVFNAQYMQDPKIIGGEIIKSEWFKFVDILPILKYKKIYADTAQKTKEYNDYSVFQCWGYGSDDRIYLIDQIRGKWEAPELKRRAVDFWNKHNNSENGSLRGMMIEDKTSGTGLIQDLKVSNRIPVKGIERNKDKVTRVMDAVPFIESGYVVLVNESVFINDFIAECESFTGNDSHKHDDQIDPLCDAISDMLINRNKGFFSMEIKR